MFSAVFLFLTSICKPTSPFRVHHSTQWHVTVYLNSVVDTRIELFKLQHKEKGCGYLQVKSTWTQQVLWGEMIEEATTHTHIKSKLWDTGRTNWEFKKIPMWFRVSSSSSLWCELEVGEGGTRSCGTKLWKKKIWSTCVPFGSIKNRFPLSMAQT